MIHLRWLAAAMVLCIAANIAILVRFSFNAGNVTAAVICGFGLSVIVYRLRHPW